MWLAVSLVVTGAYAHVAGVVILQMLSQIQCDASVFVGTDGVKNM